MDAVACDAEPWPTDDAINAINIFGAHNIIGGNSPPPTQYF